MEAARTERTLSREQRSDDDDDHNASDARKRGQDKRNREKKKTTTRVSITQKFRQSPVRSLCLCGLVAGSMISGDWLAKPLTGPCCLRRLFQFGVVCVRVCVCVCACACPFQEPPFLFGLVASLRRWLFGCCCCCCFA